MMAMRDGICPVCDSKEVYVGTTRMASTRAGAYGGNSVPINWANFAPLENFVCTDCGYVESYILDIDKLEKIREVWDRADGEAKPKRKHGE